MTPITTVLCPVDFSPATDRQVGLAVDLCRAFGARLVLHHNRATAGTGASVGWMWNAEHPPAPERTAETRLLDLMARASASVPAEARLTHGLATQAVLAVSDAVDADLIILSTHGASTDDHTSVTEQVLAGGRRAVLALHDFDDMARTPPFTLATSASQVVVVPTDLTAESRAAVDFAADLAARLPIELHLVHLLPHAAEGRRDGGESAIVARSRLDAIVPEDLRERAQLHIEEGDPAQGIVRLAARLAAACIVMGEHTRAPIRRWFSRDTSRAVLHRAPCPVWYVPG